MLDSDLFPDLSLLPAWRPLKVRAQCKEPLSLAPGSMKPSPEQGPSQGSFRAQVEKTSPAHKHLVCTALHSLHRPHTPSLPLVPSLVLRALLVMPFIQASLGEGRLFPYGCIASGCDPRALSTTLVTFHHRKGGPISQSVQKSHSTLEKKKKNVSDQQVAVMAPVGWDA